MPVPNIGRRRCYLAAVSLTAWFALALLIAPMALAQPKKSEKPTPAAPEVKTVDSLVNSGGVAEQVGYINEMLAKSWKENKITPAQRCTDYEFIRRASLDIIGRIAKLDEIARFMKDPESRRRSLLIERLLGSPEFLKGNEYGKGEEYARNWANIWTVLLITRTGEAKVYQDEMRDWLATALTEKYQSDGKSLATAPDWSKIVTELISAQGETSENGAVNYVLAHLGDEIKQDQATSGKYDMVPVTSRTTRLFLGLRTQCVQCHDHPFNDEWKQHHFWGINAFFRQVDPNGRPPMMAKKMAKGIGTQKFVLKDNPNYNVKGIVPYERRSGVLLYTDATFLDGRKMPSAKGTGKDNRRLELAKWITSSRYFAKAYVNRIWGHFFGRSFTKDAVDDFSEQNPVTHPELLDRLAEDWAKKYNHNPKALIRWICNSKAYGLASAANATNDKPEDETFFSRMVLKAMTPEQLFDSLMTATEAKVSQAKASKAQLRQAWLDKLIVNFGDDEGNEGSFNGTVVQALLLMNGSDINNAIMDKETGTAALVMKTYPPSNAAMAAKAMDILFKAALNRPPTRREISKILDPRMYALRLPNRDAVAFWTGYYQDVFWALLNSNEFILNH